MLTTLTDEELQELANMAHRGAVRLYDAASAQWDAMKNIRYSVTDPSAYDAAWAAAESVMATARTANEFHLEILRERRERREAARLARQAEVTMLHAMYEAEHA